MLENKFRGKVKYNGNHYFNNEWVYGYFIKDSKGDSFIIDAIEDEHGNVTYNKVLIQHNTVGQYIGRKSISEKEVYAGDIVDIIDHEGKKYENLSIVWDDDFCGFKAENEDWKMFMFKVEYIEIVGNVNEGE